MKEKTDLKKLRELAVNATPGPWIQKNNGYWPVVGENTYSVVSAQTDEDGDSELITRERCSYEITAFIAAANPQAIIELLNRLERLENCIKKEIHRCGNWKEGREALEGGK